ncbi:MAG: hypothetical protein ABI626_08645 [Sphingomicrobium sp.]
MLPRAGEWSFGARYSATSAKGPLRLHGDRADVADVIANSCGAFDCTLVPDASSTHQLALTLAYALTPRLTLIAQPHYIDRTISLLRADSLLGFAPVGPMLGGPDGSGRHSSAGWGDTDLLGAVSLVASATANVQFAAGVSAPTGRAGRKLAGKSDFVGYSLQTGSGTWDPIAAIDLEARSGPWTAGLEASGVVRLGHNRSGYRLGNSGTADLWLGNAITPWLSLSGRAEFRAEGRIHGAYHDHFETNVPFTELQQVDYDVNGDGVVDAQDIAEVTVYRDAFVPHVIASADDAPANHGGSELDAGIGLALHPAAGPWQSDQLSIEWLQPISTDLNGYQLARHGTLSARVTIAL